MYSYELRKGVEKEFFRLAKKDKKQMEAINHKNPLRASYSGLKSGV